MLKVRVIPTLLWKEFGLVKGVSFDSWRRVGPVLPAVKVYNARDVDELILVDIVSTREGTIPDYASISDFSEECFVPFTVGGGVANLDHMLALLHAGADKIAINSAAYSNPNLVNVAANRFGSQCLVASVDVKCISKGSYKCFSHSGTLNSERYVTEWAKELESRGAGEILLTSIERDGTMLGYDLELIEQVAESVDIPVIASGGAGNYQHMIDAIKEGGASAVAAASIFHFTQMTPAGAKTAMAEAGIPVRQNVS